MFIIYILLNCIVTILFLIGITDIINSISSSIKVQHVVIGLIFLPATIMTTILSLIGLLWLWIYEKIKPFLEKDIIKF